MREGGESLNVKGLKGKKKILIGKLITIKNSDPVSERISRKIFF